MQPDSEAFVVFLDETGTRLLRSKLLASSGHSNGVDEWTSEVRLADLERLLESADLARTTSGAATTGRGDI